jgi:hypothetical protein
MTSTGVTMPRKKSEDAAASDAASPQVQPDAAPPAPPSAVAVEAPPAPEPPDGEPSRRRPVVLVVAAVLVLALLGGLGWFVYSRVAEAASPAGVVKAMLVAYGEYDAKGMLDVSTHDTLKPADEESFAKQATDAKTKAKGKTGVINVTVVKVTETAPDKATVEVSAEWLDPAKLTYTKRTETLVVVKKDGKWLVQLF